MIGTVPVMIFGQLARALGMATIEVQEQTRAPRDREGTRLVLLLARG